MKSKYIKALITFSLMFGLSACGNSNAAVSTGGSSGGKPSSSSQDIKKQGSLTGSYDLYTVDFNLENPMSYEMDDLYTEVFLSNPFQIGEDGSFSVAGRNAVSLDYDNDDIYQDGSGETEHRVGYMEFEVSLNGRIDPDTGEGTFHIEGSGNFKCDDVMTEPVYDHKYEEHAVVGFSFEGNGTVLYEGGLASKPRSNGYDYDLVKAEYIRFKTDSEISRIGTAGEYRRWKDGYELTEDPVYERRRALHFSAEYMRYEE
jgi:hypothetical protein